MSKIKALELEIEALKARIAALEARPQIIYVQPSIVPQWVPAPQPYWQPPVWCDEITSSHVLWNDQVPSSFTAGAN